MYQQDRKELMTVSGVRGFIDEKGIAQLNLEDAARGLGFTDTSKGVEYVKWDRVRQYLNDLRFSTEVSKESFIPENIFYRLAMKAKNAAAEDFQMKVADEILPEIRRTGSYNANKYPAISQELQSIIMLDIRTQEFDQRLHRIENNTTIEHGQLLSLQSTSHKVVTELLGGRNSEAYRNKGLRSRVYKALWRDYKGYFNINSYHNTLIKSFDRALEHIESWKLPGQLQREIEEANRQMSF
ncbi:ORF6C domain-containing protein [Paenibacillus sp. FSL H8-0317]|uniref:ORF6C domain-containing protein n=1 Tax=Paenibacillus sp. FSL H8-0317 TaxID=2921385 RepID=UPI00324B2C26